MSVFVCCAVFIFISLLFICFLNYMRSVFCNYEGNLGNNSISYNELFCVFFLYFQEDRCFCLWSCNHYISSFQKDKVRPQGCWKIFFRIKFKHSIGKEFFSHIKYFRKSYYKEYGIVSNLRNTWFQGHCQSNEAPNVAQMSIQSMGGLFLAVGIGVIVATIDFFLRHYFFQILKWRRYNISNWK